MLLKKLTVLVFILTVGLSSVCARFVVEKNSLSVLLPLSLHGKRDGAIGNFGILDYGGFLLGPVVYPDKGAFGCEAFEGDNPFKSKFPRPTILLLDRGECYFALKVWNSQQAEAVTVLVADNIDEENL